MTAFKLRNIPAFVDWKGNAHAACTSLVLICSRGLRWDGGDFPTREAAIEAGRKAVAA